MKYFVYFHCRPDGSIFYVGKGIERRAKNLYRRHNLHHQNIVAKYGKENILVEITPCADEEEAYFLEQLFILLLRERGVELANKSDGGDGGSSGYRHTTEAREWMKAFQSDRPPPTEMSRRRRSTSLLCHPVSAETRRKLSAKALGRVVTTTTKEKLSKSLKGRTFSPAHLAALKKPKPPGFGEKIRAARLGVKRGPLSEATKEKMRASHQRRLCGGSND